MPGEETPEPGPNTPAGSQGQVSGVPMADQAVSHSHAPAYPWWLQPIATVVILSGFVVYSIWAALQGHGYFAPYLSPLYPPPVSIRGIPISPAFWVVWVPAGFRA